MSLKIVYLDDEGQICDVFKANLESARFVITTFTSVEDAIMYVRASPPDLVFVDFRLSGTTGDVVAQRISSSIPKVLVTGDISDKEQPPFLKVFFKPFDFDVVDSFLAAFDLAHQAFAEATTPQA